MFRSILVPVDLAEPAVAQPAIDAAADLAMKSDGRIRLVTVRSLLPVTYMEYVPADFDASSKAECEAALNAIAAGVALPRDRVSVSVKIGSVYSEVLDEAKTWGADLIVVGSHRPGMATYLLGSNATTIVRHATSSVLVIRTPAA